MSIHLSHCVYFAIMTSSCPGYELPYCTFVHDERKCSFRSLRNVLNWPLHLLFVLFSMLSEVPQIITTPLFLYFPLFPLSLHCRLFPYLSVWLSLTLSLSFPVYYIRGPVEPAAGKHVLTWTTLLNWLTMKERQRPQSVWLCASGRHVFLFVNLVNSSAHTRRCVCGYIGMF